MPIGSLANSLSFSPMRLRVGLSKLRMYWSALDEILMHSGSRRLQVDVLEVKTLPPPMLFNGSVKDATDVGVHGDF